MSDSLIKICGVTDPDDAAAAVDAGANMVGLVFVPGSRRKLNRYAALRVRDAIGSTAQTVGVFMNQSPAEVGEWADLLNLDWVQLHGEESPADWQNLGRRIIKRVRPNQTNDGFKNVLLLLDPGAGSGQEWDWYALGQHAHNCLLAGGLTPDNVAQIIATVRPLGVDVSSGVEFTPGHKSAQSIVDFVSRARLAFASLHREVKQ